MIAAARPQTRSDVRSDAHSMIMKGIPQAAIGHLVGSSAVLSADHIAAALGISTRTLRRQEASPQKLMAPELGSRAWSFAQTLAKTIEVFGARHAAELWLVEPAMGLDGERPIDLLRTQQGAELVNEFLDRLAYGVYN